MAKVILSAGYGSGFCNTNEQVYNWLKEHGGENLITVYESPSWGVMYHFARESLRYNDLVIQCIEELGVPVTVRGEALSLEQFAQLSNIIGKHL